ncbi:MAG: PepSY domain-containing protein [Candidatus Eremiobacteraeota bacterium]|nr:PepSY domain-containing protein [Candidatus Eremiobacteraeota bacterium]
MKNVARIALATTAAVLAAVPVLAYSGARYASQAKVTLPQARAIAVKTYPGKVVDFELEKEKGGSGLRYSFVIQHGSVKHEVGVDARSGKVLENIVEGANAD